MLFISRLGQAGISIWAFRELAELAEYFIGDPELVLAAKREYGPVLPGVMASFGIFYYLGGNCGRAVDVLDELMMSIPRVNPEEPGTGAVWSIYPMILCYSGRLAEAERNALSLLSSWENKDEEPVVPDWVKASITALAVVLVKRGQYEQGMALFADSQKMYPDSSFFGQLRLSERAAAALQLGDTTAALSMAERMMAGVESVMHEIGEDGVPYARSQAMAVRAAVAELQGDHVMAYDLLTEALALSREARMPDIEAGLLVQLGYRDVRVGRLEEARQYARDAIHLAEHGRLRLRQADAVNLLSQVEYLSGNRGEAGAAAVEAYRLAWCDGPPFAYAQGLFLARENLAAAGEPEPADLPVFAGE